MTETTQPTQHLIPTPLVNAAAIKRFALGISKAQRAGKFQRVSHAFIVDCQLFVQSELYKMSLLNHPNETDLIHTDEVQRHISEQVLPSLNQRLKDFIIRRIKSHPSVGKTLTGHSS